MSDVIGTLCNKVNEELGLKSATRYPNTGFDDISGSIQSEQV